MRPTEELWAGDFGHDYITRNRGPNISASALGFLARCLSKAPGVRSVIELGANIGINLDALSHLYPEATQTAVEINPEACEVLRKGRGREVREGSILDFGARGRTWDLVLVKGVLIHIPPDELPKVYDVIDKCARRYVLLAEYFNPTPVSVKYRGHEHALWKRDFASEFMDSHEGWECIDYGFTWHRDPMPQDDITHFLMARR